MALFDELGPLGFAGIEFPYLSVRIRGGIRDHIHEFPHTPGGEPEKMGRKLYEIDIDGVFQQNLRDSKWSDLWPDKISALMKLFEAQETRDLHIPTIGTVKAYCRSWDRLATAKIRSGENVSFQFVEDQVELEFAGAINFSPANLSTQMDTLYAETIEAGEDPSVWDKIARAVNDVIAVRDTIEAALALLESKIQWAISLIKEADKTLDMLRNPENWPIVEAMKELWASLQVLAQNFTDEAGAIRTYRVPQSMTTSEIASEVYGDAGRGGDILNWNAIEDPFAVAAGTSIRYFIEAA